MSEFQKYIDHGWKLCRIEPGTKGPKTPGWNHLENAVKSGEGLQAAGLLHVYSGTCTLDVDDLEKATKDLQEHGIDLNALLNAPDAVRISSGRPNRAKLVYALSEPLPSKTWGSFELRCATKDGKSVQDVLPPSPHPSGTFYQWEGNWTKLPALPEKVMQLWKNTEREQTVGKKEQFPTSSRSGIAELRALIKPLDPSMHYLDWFKVGCMLHHETDGGADGLALWNEWSRPSGKYPGPDFLHEKWLTMGGSDTPVTANSYRHQEVADIHEFGIITDAVNNDFMAEPKKANPFKRQFLMPSQWGSLPKPDWLIPGLMPKYGLGSLWGPSASGKSFLSIDLAIAVATGGMWRGHRLKQGTVCAIAAEDSFGFRMRVEAALHARGLSDAPIHVLGATPKLQEKQHREWLLEALLEHGEVSLLLVDTMAAATPGMDENSTKDATKFIDDCRQLQETLKTMCLLNHHTGKDASRGARGSSAFHGTFDVEWEIERDGESEYRTLKLAKIRNAPEFDKQGRRFAFPFKLSESNESCFVEWV